MVSSGGTRRSAKWLVFGILSCTVAAYYRWEVRAAGNDFNWSPDLNGYYDFLAQGFVSGHLYMSVEPDPRLLALPNPIDPHAGLDLPKIFDAVLYNRHYYLYHGAGPAVMLFAPYRLLTHRDFPENYALWLFCLGGFIFTALTLMRLVAMKPWVLAVMLVALACCQSIPFLMNRIWVYELAIGGGYFCIAAALYFFVRQWYVPAGLMFGMAVACRPHLAIFGAFAAIALAISNRRKLLSLVIPLAVIGLAIGLYNFERFGDPLEFGLRYQITGEYQGRVIPRLANVLPGLYYNLIAGFNLTPVFPWFLMPVIPKTVPRPREYFIEPIVGALYLAPFIPAALAVFFMRGIRAALWIVPASALVILFFLTTTGLSTQRYEVDFLPWMVLAALAAFAVLIQQHRAFSLILVAAVAFGTAINGAMGITGPYDEIVHFKPARYVKVASFFSPTDRLRPRLNPAFDEHFSSVVVKQQDHYRKDLFHAGQPPYWYEVFLDQADGKAVVVSSFHFNQVSQEIPFSNTPVDFEAKYLPASGEAIVSAGGQELLRQTIGPLVAAPAEIGPAR
jgi:MFS family permease